MPIEENSSEEKEPASPADAGGCLVSLFGLILMFGGGIAGSIAILFHGFVVPACLNVFVCIFVGDHLLHMNDG